MRFRAQVDSTDPDRTGFGLPASQGRFWTSGALVVIGLVGVLMLWAVHRVSEKRIVEETPLEASVAEMQASLASAHLLLEDRLAVRALSDLNGYWELLDRVENLANALIFGGDVRAGPTIRVPLGDPILREEIEQLLALLADYRAEARKRIESDGVPQGDVPADAAYDASLERLMLTATEVEGLVVAELAESKGRSRLLLVVLTVSWLLLVSLAVYWIDSREMQRRATANELRRSEEKLAATLRDLAEGVISTDREGRVTFVNRSAERILASSAARLVGEPLEEVFRPVEAATGRPLTFSMRDLEAISDPVEVRELELPLPGGAARALEVMISSLRDDGGTGGLVLACRDVTERKRAEATLLQQQNQLRQAQKMDAIGRLAGGLAHDINNYLSTILTQTELLEMTTEPTDRTKQRTRAIGEAVSKASSLIRRLLDFSSRQALEPQYVDVNALARDMSGMLRRLVGDGIALELALDANTGPVLADVSHLEQILANLVLNAKEAMGAGGTVQVMTRRVLLDPRETGDTAGREPAGYVLLEVRDEGEGIADENLDKIFEPFFSTKRKQGNSGFGLSTVYGIVQQSGGLVRVESRVGEGTTVRIYLPERLDIRRLDSSPATEPEESTGS